MFRWMALLLLVSPPALAADIELPFELQPRHRAMLVMVEINGRPACMLIDTGASSTFVSAELAGVHPTAIARAQFRRDGGMDVQGVTRDATVRLNATWAAKMSVIASNFAALSSRYGRRVDGVIGQDLLRRFRRVVIDVERATVILSE